MNTKHPLIFIWASMIAASGCGGVTSPEPSLPPALDDGSNLPQDPALFPDFDPDEVLPEIPDFVVDLEGRERISFRVSDDGSVGVLAEAGDAGSVLDHVLLKDTSPAVIYHAISRDPVPPELLELHAGLHADGEIEDFASATQGRLPGWMLNVSMIDTSSPCLNSTFRERHCSHPSYEANLCILNGTGPRSWNAMNAHRYKAGVCVQEGSARSTLMSIYRNTDVGDGCGYHQAVSYRYIWSNSSWSATTYLTYVWWRSSNGDRRNFHLTGGTKYNSLMDIAHRYSRNRSCD